MNTFRLILPALITLVSSISFIWLIAYYLRKEISDKDTEAKAMVSKIARIITILILFFGSWWMISLLSINEIPRSKQDRTLNKQMRENFQDRMEKDVTKKK